MGHARMMMQHRMMMHPNHDALIPPLGHLTVTPGMNMHGRLAEAQDALSQQQTACPTGRTLAPHTK
jgi:hypothetical protein